MAANDELIKLILKIEGQHEAEALRAKMEGLREKITAVGGATGTASPQVLALAADFQTTQRRLDELDRAFGRARSGMAGFGQAGMQAGRVVQDAVQGGIGGVLNNIEGLVQSLGGGAGLAGALTMVGVAAFVAKPYLMALFEGGGKTVDPLLSDIEVVKAKIKELSDKPIKLAIERAELRALESDLRKMEAAMEAYQRAKTGKTKYERESQAAVQGLVDEAGGKAVTEPLRQKIAKDMIAKDPTILGNRDLIAKNEKILEDDRTGVNTLSGHQGAMTRMRLRAEIAKAEKANQAMVAKISNPDDGPATEAVGKLLVGPVENLAKSLEGIKKPDLAHKVRGSSAEAMKRKETLGKIWGNFKDEAAKQADERKAEEEAETQNQERAVETGHEAHKASVAVKAREAKAKALTAKEQVAAETEAKRLAAGSDIDEQAQKIIDDEAAERAYANTLKGADRSLYIQRAKEGGKPILSAGEAQAKAEAYIRQRLQGATDPAGLPLANTPAVAKAMLADNVAEKAGLASIQRTRQVVSRSLLGRGR